ncbi:MAG: DNA repair protein RecO [Caldilineae bacterium]|nr:DNA repair protein RecO [Chloroflexota bacterium]MCB9176859.1 DNA repair protein RecO [Caldilineae bacterium]
MSRERLYRSQAIVLRRQDYGEADRILTLYTREHGKVNAIAKGVRRITSRKSGHVELFTQGQLLLAKGRSLDVLTQADTIEPFAALREDLVRTTYAYHVAELVDRLTEEGSPSPAVFDLLAGAMTALCEAEDPSLVARYFELRLLGLSGYRPQLFSCVVCGEALGEAGNAFSPEAGGAACPRHASQLGDAIALDASAFRVLRFLQTRDWVMASRIDLKPSTRGALERVMHAYLRHLLERDLHATGFLRSLRSAIPHITEDPRS